MAWSVDKILEESKVLENQAKQFKNDLMKIVWYMRGGISLEEAYNTCYEDREIISNIIRENLETTKKSGLPFF